MRDVGDRFRVVVRIYLALQPKLDVCPLRPKHGALLLCDVVSH